MAENPLMDNLDALQILAPVATAPIRLHVFVCTGKSCSAVDSAEVKTEFERELISRGLLFGKAKKGKNPRGSILVTECSSVGFCSIGAAVLVYPDGIWYAQVRPGDVAEIVDEHLINGRVVDRLALLKVPCGDAQKVDPVGNGDSDWEA